MAKKPEAEVVPISRFRRGAFAEDVPEAGEAPPPPSVERPAHAVATKPAVDIAARPKVWCLLGSNRSGKTTYARWLHWLAAEQGRVPPFMAALDPADRTLASWLSDVEQPTTNDTRNTASWLRDYLDFLAREQASAVLDFGGGGETALAAALAATPDLVDQIEGSGLSFVACYPLTNRPADLFVARRLEDAGFQPAATLLLLNEGCGDPYRPPGEVFAEVTRHSVFRRMVERGAQVVWMPALDGEVIEEVEKKKLPFGMARDGQVPEGKTFHPIGGLRRSAVGRWLALMAQRHQPVQSWAP